jgi:formate hydrogenlyase subunit 6/NADH:ubiquinone oxidoreductase subunit I
MLGQMSTHEPRVIEPDALEALISALRTRGFRVLGPTVRDGAIVYDELESADELPIGWGDEQSPGSYRLVRRTDEARFGYAAGPQSWKRFLFPPRIRLWRARRNGPSGSELEEEPPDPTPLAFVGVRPCELRAIEIQDRVFMGGRFVERDYAARRAGAFVVAVNCGEPAATCFCASMGAGPRAEQSYDLALTEILEGAHRLLVEAGSDRGAAVAAELPSIPATDADLEAAGRVVERAIEGMQRAMPEGDLRGLLADTLEHPRWDDVAARCLSCANCTMVCPTCFCTTVEDTTDVTGEHAERWRTWDSCFSVDHSYIHGGSIRPSGRSRYRQWLTHKLGTWHDQFGSSGCVGCGRCIAWCPVGIDITEEMTALAERGGDDADA